MLSDEFNSVFSALFGGNPLYPSTIEVLASNPSGLTREALLKKLRIESGGVISRILVELEEAGFITKLPPFGKQRRQLIYKVWDEFSLFWLSWGKRPSLGDAEKFWYQSRQSAAFYIWSGYAFENLCIKEVESLKCALGISDVKTWAGPATLSTKDGERVQIDLLLVRADRTVTIVEIKHSDGVFAVDTELATILEQRRQAVRANFGERKTVQICLVAVDGVKQSATTERLNLRCLSSHFLFQQEPNIQSEGIR